MGPTVESINYLMIIHFLYFNRKSATMPTMDTSLIITLIVLLLFAWSLYYYLFIKRESDFFYLGKIGLVIIMFVIVPILSTVLYYQDGAKDRLSATGFTPHSSFESSIGVAAGTGDNPIWMFSTELDKASIIDFYKQEQNHKSWELEGEDEKWLIFTKNNQKMRINITNDTVLLMVSPKE